MSMPDSPRDAASPAGTWPQAHKSHPVLVATPSDHQLLSMAPRIAMSGHHRSVQSLMNLPQGLFSSMPSQAYPSPEMHAGALVHHQSLPALGSQGAPHSAQFPPAINQLGAADWSYAGPAGLSQVTRRAIAPCPSQISQYQFPVLLGSGSGRLAEKVAFGQPAEPARLHRHQYSYHDPDPHRGSAFRRASSHCGSDSSSDELDAQGLWNDF